MPNNQLFITLAASLFLLTEFLQIVQLYIFDVAFLRIFLTSVNKDRIVSVQTGIITCFVALGAGRFSPLSQQEDGNWKEMLTTVTHNFHRTIRNKWCHYLDVQQWTVGLSKSLNRWRCDLIGILLYSNPISGKYSYLQGYQDLFIQNSQYCCPFLVLTKHCIQPPGCSGRCGV